MLGQKFFQAVVELPGSEFYFRGGVAVSIFLSEMADDNLDSRDAVRFSECSRFVTDGFADNGDVVDVAKHEAGGSF